jgi:cell division protein FtsB
VAWGWGGYRETAAHKAATDTINQQRKLEQESTGVELRTLEAEWFELVAKNHAIAAQIHTMKEQAAALQSDGGEGEGEGEAMQE